MVYKFNIVCDDVEDFKRVIEIDSDATFHTLCDAILDSVGFQKGDPVSFFLTEHNWEKYQEITLFDMGMDGDVMLMDETEINYIDEEGQRLIFVFDYMTERCFYMELREIKFGESMDGAVCTKKRGEAPEQYVDIDAETEKIIAKNDAVNSAYMDDMPEDGFDEGDLEGLNSDTDLGI